jgi:hypothetical protein
MITRRRRTTKTILFILLAAAPLLAQQGITQSGLQQIIDISAARRNLRPAQQKMDSNLVFGVLAAANDQSVASFRNAIAPLGVSVGITPFIQIDFDSISLNTFVSAYDVSYNPDSAGPPNYGFNVNWFGDAGFSGNSFGVDPLFFNLIAPVNTNLIVVVNQTAAGTAGLGDPYHLTVEGYVDSDFTPTPEPSMFVVCFAGLAVIFFVTRFRKLRRLAV